MRACLPYQLSSFPTSQEARLYTAKNVTFLFCFGTHIPRMLLLFLCVCVCVRTFRQRNTYVSNFRQSRPRQPLPLNGVSISSCFVFLSFVVKMYIVSFLLQSELTILTSLLRLPSVLFVNWPLERWQWWSAFEHQEHLNRLILKPCDIWRSRSASGDGKRRNVAW